MYTYIHICICIYILVVYIHPGCIYVSTLSHTNTHLDEAVDAKEAEESHNTQKLKRTRYPKFVA
jgi:hypothetical protein